MAEAQPVTVSATGRFVAESVTIEFPNVVPVRHPALGLTDIRVSPGSDGTLRLSAYSDQLGASRLAVLTMDDLLDILASHEQPKARQ